MDTLTSPTRRALDEPELCRWLGQATPGEVLEYHRGHLALDIMAYRRPAGDCGHPTLSEVAHRAWWAAEQGLAHLVQRRHGGDDYSYLIVARATPRRPRISLASLLIEEAT